MLNDNIDNTDNEKNATCVFLFFYDNVDNKDNKLSQAKETPCRRFPMLSVLSLLSFKRHCVPVEWPVGRGGGKKK